MTRSESERLALLEQRVHDMSKQLTENSADTKAIRESLDNLTGGKQALMWLTGILVSIGVIIATIVGFHK